jgi:hypothetical protein
MKKKLFYFGLSLFSILAMSAIDFNKSYAQSGATCYASQMYFCRLCSGGVLNYKQVNLCSASPDPVKELEG